MYSCMVTVQLSGLLRLHGSPSALRSEGIVALLPSPPLFRLSLRQLVGCLLCSLGNVHSRLLNL